MPIYEFRCRRCRKHITAVVLVRARIGDVRCDHCDSDDLAKQVSRFATPKSDETRLERLADPSSMADVDENDPQSVAQWMKNMGREMGEDFGDDFDQTIEEEMATSDDGGPADDG